MQFLVNYIKQLFCNHDFVFEKQEWSRKTIGFRTYGNIYVKHATCTKCAYHKSWPLV